MNRKKAALGKGLGAIIQKGRKNKDDDYSSLLDEAPLGEERLPAGGAQSAQSEGQTKHTDGSLIHLPVEYLQRGRYQPRREIDAEALQSLADSIKQQGVMQPIVVRKIENNRYEIIAGERRWRASQLASLERVPCILREVDDQSTVALSLIENIQREDLTPIEEAIALQRLQQEFDLTHQQIADAVGKSRATISNLIRLLGLTEDVKKMLDSGDLEMGHARALLTLPEYKQSVAAKQVVAKELTVRQTEKLVKKLSAEEGCSDLDVKKSVMVSDPDIQQLESRLSLRLGSDVKIQHASSGKGKLVLRYNSLEELDGILAHIQ